MENSVSADGNNPLFIGFEIFDNDNIKNEHVSVDTDIWWPIVHPN